LSVGLSQPGSAGKSVNPSPSLSAPSEHRGTGVGSGLGVADGPGVGGAERVVPETMFEYSPNQLTFTARIRYE
jgi:hypothetical protein